MSPNGLRHVERAHHELERRVLQVRPAQVRLPEVAARQVAELEETDDVSVSELGSGRRGSLLQT